MMKSIKLNQTIRDDILLSIMSMWDEKNTEPDIKTAEHTLALWLWGRCVGKGLSFDGVPDKFLNKSTGIKFSFGGDVNQVHLEYAMPVWWGRYDVPVLEVFEKEHKELKKFHKTNADHETWRAQRDEIKRESAVVLESVNTTKQLVEMWPQCEPFLPAYVANPDQAVRLPAIPLSRLNERLGIKVAK